MSFDGGKTFEEVRSNIVKPKRGVRLEILTFAEGQENNHVKS